VIFDLGGAVAYVTFYKENQKELTLVEAWLQ
jgi:hypothetical protein